MHNGDMDHRDIIKLWPAPSIATIASDLRVPYQTAAAWKQRNSIPWVYWPSIVEKARERRIYVTPEHLMANAERRVA